MTSNFKKLSQEVRRAEPRAAIPQVDPETPKSTPAASVAPTQPASEARAVEPAHHETAAEKVKPEPPNGRPIYITTVDTSELPTNRGFAMYPSRHTQLVRDLTFLEGRRPWLIIEDAIEEYVVRHYGKEYGRR